MSWAVVAVAGASLVGGAMAANAAGDAADTQADASDRASQSQERIANRQLDLQKDQFDRQVELQQPFRDLGLSAQNRLAFLTGLSETGYKASDPQILAIRNRLAPQFQQSPEPGVTWEDTPALDAAVNAELQRLGGAQGGQQGAGYGSLMRDFGMADYEADPGYAFRQAEGEKAMQRAASAGGLLGSGKFLKDSMRFNQDLASTEYGNAFNRFQVNRSNKLNALQSLGGVGQTATNAIGQAGQNYASGASGALGAYGSALGSNILGAGNAQAAGQVGGANAWNNAISQGVGMYQQNQMMNRFFPQGGGGTSYGAWQQSPMSNTLYSNGSLGD